ncbi:MAG: YtxH domain-containing protein [Acidobacteriota bacterium]
MSDSSDRVSKLAYFLVGGGIGAIVALLFAPRSGRETRELIAQRAAESRERVAATSRNVSEKVSGYIDKGKETLSSQIERGKEMVSSQKEQIAAAIEAGKQAYRDERAKSNVGNE